ncbi:hypothetical protein [Eubacterium sp. 1001713B170207_170306_E7]|uniref:hypothetical protein n=1 Tax=Eubacterium sp. 1001713B170207_170306_E7 TaxID=2787097 RepID=UPI0018991B80|nr:hypothetical protein [Eubacterium sp. 1001713B170207_170306_E7]
MNANIKNKKTIVLLSIVAVLAAALVGFTVAMLNQRSQAATNEFSGATVNIGVVENGKTDEVYEDGVKGNTNHFDKVTESYRTVGKKVAIKNIYSDDYPTAATYVRVRLVPCFRYATTDETKHQVEGELVPIDMKGQVTYSALGEKWVKWPESASDDDAYYYYTLPLEPNQVTSNLIESVTYNGEIPENAYFELQVLTEGVSAKQEGAAADAWKNIPTLEKPAPSANTNTNE